MNTHPPLVTDCKMSDQFCALVQIMAYLNSKVHCKGPFCNPGMLFFCLSSVDIIQNNVISKFSVNSDVFASSAQFTVSHCCIGQYMYGGILKCQHLIYANLMISLTSESARNILHTNIMYPKAGFYCRRVGRCKILGRPEQQIFDKWLTP